MIPDSDFASQTANWKQILAQSIRSIDELLNFCGLDPQDHFDTQLLQQDFPLMVTRYYASLIERGNPEDPLLKQVLIDDQENKISPGYSTDPVGDIAAMPIPGLIHKYPGRILLNMTGACAIHCRYCFRRHFPYAQNRIDLDQNGVVMSYLKQHPEIREVILSGGDPLMLSDNKLSQLMMQMNTLKHLHTVRIHSRIISVLPQRITAEFIQALNVFKGNRICVTHINHAQEIDCLNQEAFKKLRDSGIHLFNQSVLLKDINDNVETLKNLSYALISSGVIPYYLHRLDKIQGAAHFDIPEEKSCQLYRQLTTALPGYLLPRMVDEIAGEMSKSPVHCEKNELLSSQYKKL